MYGPLALRPMGNFIHYDFRKGQDLESYKKSLHKNIDNFMSYGPINMRQLKSKYLSKSVTIGSNFSANWSSLLLRIQRYIQCGELQSYICHRVVQFVVVKCPCIYSIIHSLHLSVYGCSCENKHFKYVTFGHHSLYISYY